MLGVFKGKLGLICFLFISTGPGVLDYTLHTEEHKCKKDALLGRIKHLPDKTWKLIRPRPTKTQYVGPYYICKGNIYECVNSLAQKLPLYKCYKKKKNYFKSQHSLTNTQMLPVLFQRWLLEKSACILATVHLHTARKRLMFGLWSEKGSSPENCSSILTGPTPMSGWLSLRSYRSTMGYSCFSVEWVFI